MDYFAKKYSIIFEIWLCLKRIRFWNCDQITFFNVFMIALNLMLFLVIPLQKVGLHLKYPACFLLCSDRIKERKINLPEQRCYSGKGKGNLKPCISVVGTLCRNWGKPKTDSKVFSADFWWKLVHHCLARWGLSCYSWWTIHVWLWMWTLWGSFQPFHILC